jgi:hypothetical protein
VRNSILKLALGLAVLAALTPAAWSATRGATAADHKFHAHVDAYHQHPYNCGISTWSDRSAPFGGCYGRSGNGNNGTALGFSGTLYIVWCRHDVHLCKNHVDHPHAVLPHGYDRWMRICRGLGNEDCHNYLLAAVKMPNGPFAVMFGRVDGHQVRATSTNENQVEHNGGPLFLYVGYHGSISNGGGVPASHGYVFGFRGWLHY